MSADGSPLWKPGQSCRWKGRWATVSYPLPEGKVLITFDDGSQQMVIGGELTKPTINVVAPKRPTSREGRD